MGHGHSDAWREGMGGAIRRGRELTLAPTCHVQSQGIGSFHLQVGHRCHHPHVTEEEKEAQEARGPVSAHMLVSREAWVQPDPPSTPLPFPLPLLMSQRPRQKKEMTVTQTLKESVRI